MAGEQEENLEMKRMQPAKFPRRDVSGSHGFFFKQPVTGSRRKCLSCGRKSEVAEEPMAEERCDINELTRSGYGLGN